MLLKRDAITLVPQRPLSVTWRPIGLAARSSTTGHSSEPAGSCTASWRLRRAAAVRRPFRCPALSP